jgi:hypothetical protein
VIALGKSILNRTSVADIGALMLSYGGGGHANAGTCQVPHDDADRVIEELVGHLDAAQHGDRLARRVDVAAGPGSSATGVADAYPPRLG